MYSSMSLENLRRNWDGLGRVDPLWAILARPERLGGGWEGDESLFFATGKATVDGILDVLDRQGLRPSHLDRALDFGCGVGRLTQALVPHVKRVDGVDIAASMIDLARQYNKFPGRAFYHLNSASNLRLFNDGSFNLLVSVIVLQHIPNSLKRQYLAEFVRVLRPGGLAIFTVPSHGDLSLEGIARRTPNSLQNIYRRRRYGYESVIEFHPLRRRAVEAVIIEAGGEVAWVEQEHEAGPRFHSFLYVVRKPSSQENRPH